MRLEGRGLHGGQLGAVTLRRAEGPTTFGREGDRAPIGELAARGEDRASALVLPSGARVLSVEHLLAAVNARGAFDGLAIDVEGDELPLLDGCALRFAEALADLAIPTAPARLRIARATRISIDDATYELKPVEQGERRHVEARIEFPLERFGRQVRGVASFSGDFSLFVRDVATARTFGARRELEALRARGLAAHVPEGSVVALDVDDERYAPRDEQEPVRHKLLDLLGDLATLGAVLSGVVIATRPSHRTTRLALARALDEGIIVPC